MSLVLFLHDVVYLPTDYYCFVPFTNAYSMLWLAFVCYGNQIGVLSFIYIRITIFLRRQTNTPTLVVKQRQDRDLLVIRRILIIVALLISLGVPGIVFLVKSFITNTDDFLTFPFVFFFISISMIGVCISTIIFTPQLKKIVVKIIQHNRVIPLNDGFIGSIPTRQ
ncbi:unnamed protein product [Adineta steineri]|uniref:G-protein coupled receptors family 1 profile domain-containing protein n=1 Tax=Adineta steineri TaxID=433720 RepID=A0A816C4J5_9BILA|nr:unnamed protein product [Adineta steineri]CAF1616741.1 unnamed protein product [Adineta steineri]